MDGIEIYCDRVGTYKPEYNKTNGRFAKGHTPHNKGKKWSEFMSEQGQRNSKKGWNNLELHRPTKRPDTAGRCRKPVVAINLFGKLFVFPDTKKAAEFLVGGCRANISHCCRCNHNGLKPTYKPFAKKLGKKPTKTNTDHSYMGLRWYFEADIDIWKDKVMKDFVWSK